MSRRRPVSRSASVPKRTRPTCADCGAPLLFLRNESTGSTVPLNPAPVYVLTAAEYAAAGARPPSVLFVRTVRGVVSRARRLLRVGDWGYTNHKATCSATPRPARSRARQLDLAL